MQWENHRLKVSIIFVLFLCATNLSTIFVKAQQSEDFASENGIHLSKRLVHFLWANYDRDVKPQCGLDSNGTIVTLRMDLRQINDVNEQKQILTTNVWLYLEWIECRIAWNNSDFGNLSRVVVPSQKLWIPDLTLYDNADSVMNGFSDNRVSVSSDSKVLYSVPLVLNSLCKLDVSIFPFDTQRCNLTFGSWSYHGQELALTSAKNPVSLESFVTNGEWVLVNFTAQTVEPEFDGISYPQVIFTFVLKRKYKFYAISLLFPMALIQLMAGVSFLLSPKTHEKMVLQLTLLVSVQFLQQVAIRWTPVTSETLPIIVTYISASMTIVSVSCLTSVIVLAAHFSSRHMILPQRVRRLLDSRLAVLLCGRNNVLQLNNQHTSSLNTDEIFSSDVESPALGLGNRWSGCCLRRQPRHGDQHRQSNVYHLQNYADLEMTSISHNDVFRFNNDVINFESCKRNARASKTDIQGQTRERNRQSEDDTTVPVTDDDIELTSQICRRIVVTTTRKRQFNKEYETVRRREWEHVATVLDRIFLVVFLAFTLALFLYFYITVTVE